MQSLRDWGAIKYSEESVRGAGFNVIDDPYIARYVPELTHQLYAQVKQAGIEYDAVTSCPRGGDAWARAFIAHAQQDGRNVPFYRLNKVGTRKFSIIDGQFIYRGARLLLVDDTIFEGATSSSAAMVLEEAGFKIAGLLFPVEIGKRGRERWDKKGCPVFSVFNNAFIEELSKV